MWNSSIDELVDIGAHLQASHKETAEREELGATGRLSHAETVGGLDLAHSREQFWADFCESLYGVMLDIAWISNKY